MAMRTGGRIIADQLAALGVTHIFAVPGESYLDTLDGLYAVKDRIELITCRFEAGAVNMAEAHGKLTGKPGVAFVTRGPGACHGAIGVHIAAQDSTPLLLFVGQIPLSETDRESFQEVDYRRMFGGMAKWVTQIDDAARIPELVAHAYEVALSGRPGPVVIALSEEMQAAEADVADRAPLHAHPPHPAPAALDELDALLAKAERPLAIIGGSVWSERGRADIAKFLTARNIPTCVAFRRQGLYDGALPNFAGDLGVGADPGLVAAAREADVVLAIGTRIGEPVTQGFTLFCEDNTAKIVHIHRDAGELGRVSRPALGIAADLNAVAHALAARPAPSGAARWAEWTKKLRARRESQREPQAYPGPVNIGRILRDLESAAPADTIFASDAGNFGGWVTRFLNVGAKQEFLGPTNGAMGYGVPAAIGAAILNPGRAVVGFMGDGGFLMTGTEFATALQYGAAPIMLIFNNSMYGTIRMYQERRFPGRISGTELANPDFAAYARAFGGHGETVRKTEEFLPAFARARESGKPAIIEIVCEQEQITSRTTVTVLREAGRKSN